MLILRTTLRVVAAAGLLGATAVAAEDRVYPSDGQTRYDTAREARAARSEAKRERDEDPARLEQNRFARCDVQTGDDRELCVRRMKGEGVVQGSVQGGGIYRELTVTVPAPR